jgi:hypothetical protein
LCPTSERYGKALALRRIVKKTRPTLHDTPAVSSTTRTPLPGAFQSWSYTMVCASDADWVQ